MADIITKAELARRLGVTRSTVNGYNNKGQLAMKKRKGVLLVDYDATVKLLASTKDPARAEFAKANTDGETAKRRGPITFSDARTAKEAARARLAQIAVKEKEAQLVNADEVLFALKDLFLDIRNSIRSIPAKATGEIMNIIASGKPDISSKVYSVLRRETDEPLETLSKWKLPNYSTKQ